MYNFELHTISSYLYTINIKWLMLRKLLDEKHQSISTFSTKYTFSDFLIYNELTMVANIAPFRCISS